MMFRLAVEKKKAAPQKVRPPVRVRHDPPSLEEAVFAAEGLTENTAEQAEIAASLMNVTVEQVRPLVQKAAARKAGGARLIVSSRPGAQRMVVVERARTFRRPAVPSIMR